MNDLWNQLAARAGRSLSPEQHQFLERYLDLLSEANAVMNLTRIEDRAAARISHIADALTLLPYLPAEAHRLADVGSGGGVPGLPLAIARPDVQVTLIESTKKKAAFLSRTAEALGLANVEVIPDRAEAIARGPQRESFDIVTARAVGALAPLAEWCIPLLRKGGRLLAMKGPKLAEELPEAEKALKRLNAALPTIHPAELPGAENHVIVEILKVGRLPQPKERHDGARPRPGQGDSRRDQSGGGAG